MSKSPSSFLPYGHQDIDEDDIAAVTAVLRGDWLTSGPMVERFEAALAERVGARHAVACSNGTTALHLAALGAGLSSGQVAVVPAVTFQATASAILQTGAEVVFADVDPSTALLGAEHLDDAVERAHRNFPDHKVACAFPVHMAGQAVHMESLAEMARHHGLTIVEDAAHALGTIGSAGTVGNCQKSEATIFSFHPVMTGTHKEEIERRLHPPKSEKATAAAPWASRIS